MCRSRSRRTRASASGDPWRRSPTMRRVRRRSRLRGPPRSASEPPQPSRSDPLTAPRRRLASIRMGGATDIFDLGRLTLHSGEGRRLQLEVDFDPLDLGGQRYTVEGGRVPVTLDVAHTTNGWSLRLRYDATLDGPCMR